MSKPDAESQFTEDTPVDGGSGRLSHSTRTAAEHLAEVVSKDHGCRQGKTALYWAIIGVVLRHAKKPDPE